MIDHAIQTMPFGKYVDQPLDEIPDRYLLWLVTGNIDGLDEDLFIAIRETLHENAVRSLIEMLGRRPPDPELLKCARAIKRRAQRLGVDRGMLRQLGREIIRCKR